MQPLRGRLRPHAHHAGHVVHRVADERLIIDDLIRPHAPVFIQLRAVDHLAFAEVEDLHAVRQRLAKILVRRTDEDFEPALFSLLSNGRHDVVGFVAGGREEGDAHPFHHLLDHRLLEPEVVRRRVAVCLVVRIDCVAEGRPRHVEGRDEVVGTLVVERHECPSDAEHGVGGSSVRRRHRADAVKHLEDQPVGIEQVQAARGRGVGHGNAGNLAERRP